MNVGSLHEMIGLYSGLELQWYIRTQLAMWPSIIFFLCFILIPCRHFKDWHAGRAFWEMALYFVTSLFILSAFWPDVTDWSGDYMTDGSDVTSVIAERDNAPVRTAQQFRAQGNPIAEIARVPIAYRLYIEAISNAWIGTGEIISEASTRPQSNLMPVNWLMRFRFDAGTVADIQDWVSKCILPAQQRLAESGMTLHFQDTQPFPGSRLFDEMGFIRVAAGQGILNLVSTPILCTQYTQRVEQRAFTYIQNSLSPAGRSIAAVWSDELGISAIEATRFILMREVQLATGPDVPTQSLVGKYLGVKAASILAKAGANAAGSVLGPALGFGVGAAQATAGEVSQVLDRLGSVIGAALFFAHYFTVIMGWAMTIVIALFPLAILLSLASPGHQFTPVLAALALHMPLFASPFIFGLMELWASTIADSGISILANPVQWADKQVSIILIQALGPLAFLVLSSVVGSFLGGYAVLSRLGRVV